jgi:hypothetical protein
VLLFAGCGGGGGSGGGNGNGGEKPIVVDAPADFPAGMVFDLNNGVRWTIASCTGANFLTSPPYTATLNCYFDNTIAGNFTAFYNDGYASTFRAAYFADASGAKLTLTGTGDGQGKPLSGSAPVVATLTNFTKSGGTYTGCAMSIEGQSFVVTFTGAKPVEPPKVSGIEEQVQEVPPELDTAGVGGRYIGRTGLSYDLIFQYGRGDNLPWGNGTTVHTEIRQDGTLVLGEKVMKNYILERGGETVKWTDGDLQFWVNRDPKLAMLAPELSEGNYDKYKIPASILVFRNGEVIGLLAHSLIIGTPIAPDVARLEWTGKTIFVFRSEYTVTNGTRVGMELWHNEVDSITIHGWVGSDWLYPNGVHINVPYYIGLYSLFFLEADKLVCHAEMEGGKDGVVIEDSVIFLDIENKTIKRLERTSTQYEKDGRQAFSHHEVWLPTGGVKVPTLSNGLSY